MRLNAIGIICSDIEASLRFYRALGVPLGDYSPDEGHYEADLGGFRLMLDSEAVMASFMEGFTTPRGNDRVTLAIECGSPLEVDAGYEAAISDGFGSVKAPFDAVWGQRYATVADPDGNHVDLYAAQ